MEEFVSCNVFNYQHEVYTKKKKREIILIIEFCFLRERQYYIELKE